MLIPFKKIPLSTIFLTLIITFFLFSLSNNKDPSESCKDPEGNEVDWYVIFLFPKIAEKSKILTYGYFDDSSTSLRYIEHDSKNFPPLDFTYLNDKSSETNYIFWNDDKSTEKKKDKSSDSKGHTKGGLIYNKSNARYLMHSLPRFPYRQDETTIINDLPSNAGIYGQHFFCISLNTPEAIKLIDHIIITNPQLVYKHGQDDRVGINSEQVNKLLSEKADRNRETFGELNLTSKKGKKFDVYSKGSGSEDLPFDGIIPNAYESSIFVETWTKPEILDIICTGKYKVLNVLTLKFGKYLYGKDNEHSKWGVLEKKPIACFSDLNRVNKQKYRGGLTICVQNGNLANIMRSAITDYEKCPTKKKLKENSSEKLVFLED